MARILIIEDNAENLELMSYLLKAFGHTVEVVRDGVEGIAAGRADTADLIVCDIHLPKKDGYEIVRELKGDSAWRQVPLVAVTALAMVGDRDKLLAAGFDGYIAKPIDPQAFVKQIETYLPQNSIPVRSAMSSPAPAVSVARSVPATRSHILVVDDSAANRELTRAILEPFGYQLTIVSSVKDALAVAARKKFDLILSDVHMPTQDGLGFLASVKADPALRDTPFLLISSSVRGMRDQERARELGAMRFLLRPMDPDVLLGQIADCLEQERKK